ncbi:MAG: type II toxin-antitoxin system HicB family antitoxin [Acidobacteriota bacterium]
MQKFLGSKGVWANGPTVEACRRELVEVVEEWLILKLRDNDPIPPIEGIEIKITEDRLGIGEIQPLF